MGAHQLDTHFGRFRPGGQQERFIQAGWSDFAQLAHQGETGLAGKTIVVNKPMMNLIGHRLGNGRVSVTGIGHEYIAGPVEPLIAPAVENMNTLRAIPEDRRLAGHRHRLGSAQCF